MNLLPKDTDGNDLVPGQLYCLGEMDIDNNPTYGSLAWYASDGEFYSADYDDSVDAVTWPYDFAVKQTGSFDLSYV